MLEHLTGKLLQRLLSKFCVDDGNNNLHLSVWSGFVQLSNLQLKTDPINQVLAQDGLPFRVVQCHIQQLEVTIPWSKLSSTSSSSSNKKRDPNSSVVVVMDGVHVLLTTHFDLDHAAIRQAEIEKRQRALQQAQQEMQQSQSSSQQQSWKDMLQNRLSEGILQQLADHLELHIRNVHIRLEDDENWFATGVVFESLHIQHDEGQKNTNDDENENNTINKVAQLNHLGIYWNALDETNTAPLELTLLQRLSSTDEITQVLDRSIARRSLLQQNPAAAPKHTYVLVPVDGTMYVTLSNRTQVHVDWQIPDVALNVRDFQCLQCLQLVHDIKEHKYSQRYRLYRPAVSATENPRAWWQYAVTVISQELKSTWSWRRFQRRFECRKRYCDLYERKLRSDSADDAAGPAYPNPLCEDEAKELQDMEDGVVGDLLSVEDIILYRIMVKKRIGLQDSTGPDTRKTSWLRRTVSSFVHDDSEAEEEFHQLLTYWQQWSENVESRDGVEFDSSQVAVSVKLRMQTGRVRLFSPLGSTADQSQYRRLHQKFLEFTYSGFDVCVNLMGDFETVHATVTLADFVASEERSNRKKYAVVSRLVRRDQESCSDHGAQDPLVHISITKNPPTTQDFHVGIQAELRALEAVLVPECEWIGRLKTLLQPIPQLRKAAKYWSELSMATINAWASGRLGFLAKAQAAVSEHKNLDLDVVIECPVIRISDGAGSDLVLDFGQAHLRTERLAGVADAKLLRSVGVGGRRGVPGRPSVSSDGGSTHERTEISSTGLDVPLSPVYGKSQTGRSDSVGPGTSIRLDNSMRLDSFGEDYTAYEHFASTGVYATNDVKSLFYDTYELQLQTDGVRIDGLEYEAQELSGAMDVRVCIHKSIIPADHTLCRFKAFLSVEKVSISVSESDILHLGKFVEIWWSMLVNNSSFYPIQEYDTRISTIRVVNTDPRSGQVRDDIEEDAASFDENEFFDAVENDSCSADNVSVLLDETWITDSDSVLGSETRSVNRSIRNGRRRQPSIVSDVSSLSETSIGKRRAHLHENDYLTAENLARLEEAADEESDGDEGEEIDMESFRSALSLNQLLTLANDLDAEIQEAESYAKSLREHATELRGMERQDDLLYDANAIRQRQNTKKTLRIELQRSIAELKALRASKHDLLSQVKSAEVAQDELDGEEARVQASQTVREAAALMQGRKRRSINETAEHNLTSHLNRELFQCWVLVKSVAIKLQGIQCTQDSFEQEEAHKSLSLSVGRSAVVLRQYIGESRLYTSIEHARVSLSQNADEEASDDCLLAGGVDSAGSGSLLPSRFPQFISSASMEEKFFQGAFEIRRGRVSAQAGVGSPIAKLRLVFGDMEFTPRVSSLRILRAFLLRIRAGLPESVLTQKRSGSEEARFDADQTSRYFDVAARFASIRSCFTHNGEQVGALALTEVGARFTGALTGRVFKDRSQLDARCSNLQILCIDDLGAGRGTELLGRRDLYSPIIRIRMRNQIVPNAEVSGWVSGQPSSSEAVGIRVAHLGSIKGDDGSTLDLVRNMHVGMQVDSVGVRISPQSITRLQMSLFCMRDFAREVSSGRKEHTHAAGQEARSISKSPQIRWRLDLLLKKSSLVLQTQNADEIDELTRRKLLLSFAMKGVMQKLDGNRHGVHVRATLSDVSVSRVLDERPILEAVSICIRGKALLSNRFCLAMADPHLCIPDDSSWSGTDSAEPAFGCETPDDDLPFSVAVSTGLMKINATTSIAVLLADIVSDFKSLKFSDVVKEDKPKKEAGIYGFVNSSHQIGLSVKVEGVTFTLLREGLNLAMLDRALSFSVEDVRILFRKRASSMNSSISASNGSVVDYSCRAGICALKSEINYRESLNEGDVLRTDGPGLLVAACGLSASSGEVRGSFEINLGRIHFLVLPALLRTVRIFCNELKTMKLDKSSTPDDLQPRKQSNLLSTLLEMKNISFRARIESIGCIFSSRDVLKFVRECSDGPIGVVVVRFRAELRGKLTSSLLTEACDHLYDLQERNGDNCSFSDALGKYLQRREEAALSLYLSSDSELHINDFQVLRTTIRKVDSPATPHSFRVVPPPVGEQRITNSFSFEVAHQLSGVHAPFQVNVEDGLTPLSISHSLHIEAEFIDVLLYIAQSAGGIHDAFLVTVKPILDMLTEKRNHDTQEEKSLPRHSAKTVMARAPTTLSVRAEGLQITCVPGGATRLTESPIIKLALLGLSSGAAFALVPSEVKLLSDANLDSLVPGVTVSHLFAGSWLNCKISASYHNRRLVAWEPFIEPWEVEIQVGVDLVRTLKFKPVHESSCRKTYSGEPVQSTFASPLKSGGERLRGIGRLLRSPFSGESPSRRERGLESLEPIDSDSDVCYLMLASRAGKICRALDSKISSKQRPPLSTLPSSHPTEWLSHFGYPPGTVHNRADTDSQPAVVFCASDSVPLNLNITGSLIENLWDYLGKEERPVSRRLAPHWIRNDSGLTLRYQEILDADRLNRGERAPKIILSNGSEVPLSLKRSLSQSCDPHNAYILLEFGSFDEIIGRAGERDYAIPKGARSSTFYYRCTAKVPVDTVGVHQYPLDWNFDKRFDTKANGNDPGSRSVGWVIVRVALRSGIKMVSVESPLAIKNISDTDILCEARDNHGLSLLWRCVVPKPDGSDARKSVSLPADLAPSMHEQSYFFSIVALPQESDHNHESEIFSTDMKTVTRISPPPPYSRSSFSKGLIEETDTSVHVLDTTGGTPFNACYLNICLLRIGTYSFEQPKRGQHVNRSAPEVPEQRMILLRSPLVIRNYLALPILVQVRLRIQARALGRRSSLNGKEALMDNAQAAGKGAEEWTDLGILDCGQCVSWTGAVPNMNVETRIRFSGPDGSTLPQFPSWSTPIAVPSDGGTSLPATRSPIPDSCTKLSKMTVIDSSDVPLEISVTLGRGSQVGADIASSTDSAGRLSQKLPLSSRVVSLYAPFWIVDGTGLDLQYKSSSFVAGQADSSPEKNKKSLPPNGEHTCSTRGLGELLDDSDLLYLPSRRSFQVLMIGEEGSRGLYVRRRLTRVQSSSDTVSEWSEPIPLTLRESSYHDTAVLPPPRLLTLSGRRAFGVSDVTEPFALRSHLIRAPDSLGGFLGTRILHIVCRYAIVNEMGRDIEILSGRDGEGTPFVVRADGRLRPFHFDDLKPIRFRPKEFGWLWSGRFHVTSRRRELTLRLKHKLKGHAITVNVEFHAKKATETCVMVLRPAAHAPYRLENHSMYPLQYNQISSLFGLDGLSRITEPPEDEMLLPFHHSDFAWDEPEYGRRSIVVYIADFRDFSAEETSDKLLGRFNLDRISPGAELRLGRNLVAQVLADGPTRVLRIAEPSAAGALRRADSHSQFQKQSETDSALTSSLQVKFCHGIGISVVDWRPQELVYIRLENILLEQKSDGSKETVSASVGSIFVDNQLWVTPYPVALRMGSRTYRRRRNKAVSISWRRSLTTRSAYGDLTLLEKVELSTEPSVISIDGNLAQFAIDMFHQIKEMGVSEGHVVGIASRNKELRRVLEIEDSTKSESGSLVSVSEQKRKSLFVDDLYSAVDYMATAAIASKLRSCYRPPSQGAAPRRTEARPDTFGGSLMSVSPHKYYIERLRISTTLAEVSWSGSLPIHSSYLRWMRPALTFEGFPLFLRPYSSSHAYGTAEDHLISLKSHYISIWRVMDLLVGLIKPTFLFRAWYFTTRDVLASSLASISGNFQALETGLLRVVSSPNTSSRTIGRVLIDSVFNFTAAVLRGLSKSAASGSSFLEYDPARHRAKGGLVRTRSPRLFANIDGKDLLVEYVEGENAGKALLSRVRTGAYLGEGYIYHVEGAHLRKARARSRTEMDPTMLIFMMTFERVLLLNGELNADFCDVVWEASFEDLVHVELERLDIESHDLILLWYLAGARSSTLGQEDRYAAAMVSDSCGLDTLLCKSIFIPRELIEALLGKIGSVNKKLLDDTEGSPVSKRAAEQTARVLMF